MATDVDIDHKQELLVAGYMREIEIMYKMMNIPMEIIHIIYLYKQFCDKWDKKYSHNSIIIDDITNQIMFTSIDDTTAFGCHVVEGDLNGFYKWKIRLISIKYDAIFRAHPYVGIIKDDENILNEYIDNGSWQFDGYQFCGGTGSFYSMDAPDVTHSIDFKWKCPNDILEIILDFEEQTLKLVLNEKESVIVSDCLEKGRYRLALGCNNAQGAQFELL